MSSDPWQGLRKPQRGGVVTGKRVDPSLRWDCFWALDGRGRRAWVLMIARSGAPRDLQLPSLRGLDLSWVPAGGDGHIGLLLTLKDADAAELFHRLCLDLVTAAAGAPTESEATSRVVHRTWRWHRLLRGALAPELTHIEQMGLMAELATLERISVAQPRVSATRSWTGPVGTAKDFELGSAALEVKAKRLGAHPEIRISSEHQLDTADFSVVYLVVYPVSLAVVEATDALTLHAMVTRLRRIVDERHPGDRDLLDARLSAAGYGEEHSYAEKWLVGEPTSYQVKDGFPVLTPKTLPDAVSRVTYSVDPRLLDEFKVTWDELILRIGRNR